MRAEGRTTLSVIRRLPVRAAIFAIELYRTYVSPLRLPTCRFMPTCSQYAVEALTEYGLIHGGWLTIVRLLKCGPWHRGGWDPIPERRNAGGVSEREHGHPHDATDDGRDSPATRGESESLV